MAYRSQTDANFTVTRSQPLIKDLDLLPYPARHLLPMNAYDEDLHVRKVRAAGVITSRGCPFKYSFCASPFLWKRIVRQRSVANVIGELRELVEEYGYQGVHFYDDDFCLDATKVEDLCHMMIRERLNIKWICLSRARTINARAILCPS